MPKSQFFCVHIIMSPMNERTKMNFEKRLSQQLFKNHDWLLFSLLQVCPSVPPFVFFGLSGYFHCSIVAAPTLWIFDKFRDTALLGWYKLNWNDWHCHAMFTGTARNWKVFCGCDLSSASFVYERTSRPWTHLGKMICTTELQYQIKVLDIF